MIKSNKFTPGPWVLVASEIPDDQMQAKVIAPGQQHSDIAEIYHGDHNARLIAAAPELIELLAIAKNYVVVPGDPRSVELYEAIETLITKATGGAE